MTPEPAGAASSPGHPTSVLAARLSHETHSFNLLPTGLAEFAQHELMFGAQIMEQRKGTRTEIGGFIDAAAGYGWSMRWVVAASAMPGGPIPRACYEALVEPLLRAAASTQDLRVVLLSLHGSMVVDGIPDAEGDLLERLRAVAGPDVLLAGTLDLHANVTDAMVRQADLLTSYRTTPHVDQYETAVRLCALVQATLQGRIRPVLHHARRPMVAGMDLGRTLGEGPMTRLQRQARAFEKTLPGVLDLSLLAGYSYGDLPEAGPSALAISDGPGEAAQGAIESLMDCAWQWRAQSTVRLVPVQAAVAQALAPDADPRPLILADYTDGPGGGGYGDGTRLLAALLSAGVQGAVVGPLFDPAAARTAIDRGVGNTVHLQVGGHTDPRFGGGPLAVDGVVTATSDGSYTRKGPFETGTQASLGPCACIRIGTLQLLVASYRIQAEDREQFRILGVVPEAARVIALKGINHFRADFEAIARDIVFVDSGGIHAADLSTLPYRQLRRPVWPLDALP